MNYIGRLLNSVFKVTTSGVSDSQVEHVRRPNTHRYSKDDSKGMGVSNKSLSDRSVQKLKPGEQKFINCIKGENLSKKSEVLKDLKKITDEHKLDKRI